LVIGSKPLVVFAGGGSGGHLYPTLAVADILRSLLPGVRFVFFGTDRPIDGTVLAPYEAELIRQAVRPLPRRPWQIPGFLAGWRSSIRQCRRYFREHRPIAVLGSGGYAAAPPICEAARADIPTALLNPDAIAGRANRLLGSRVDTVFAQWPQTAESFNGRTAVQVTGCPVRPEFKQARRDQGLAHFGLDPQKKVLLVTGASLGARSINLAMVAALGELSEHAVWQRWQVLHLTGAADHSQVAEAYQARRITFRVVEFTKHMALAMAAADLVFSRAGASTLAEITALGRPSLLMPYPHHRDQHQVANARVLVKLGAARTLLDRSDPRRNAPVLAEQLHRLMDDEAECTRMADAARRIGTTNAATVIAQHLLELADRGCGESVEKTCLASR
jgi:UDP-N-acetylglucosamine--N-acetylmuramyl-(pentapeptide) pyrophosphoryl-undecaprenol N-acetylglucosamine transferase